MFTRWVGGSKLLLNRLGQGKIFFMLAKWVGRKVKNWPKMYLRKDASTVKAGFKSVPLQLILNLPLFFWPS